MHLFVFPNAMPRRGEERIKLNIEGTVFHFFHDEEEVIIETALLRDGSSTMVLNNTITGKTYALYNFRRDSRSSRHDAKGNAKNLISARIHAN